MARKGRIEFPGAVYHVLDRGDRREPIVRTDNDRMAFIRTLAQACERAGWRVHAFVLMGNHYHLLIETPQANLVAGMRWFQTTWTVRFNRFHRLSGHLFQGRYKAVIVDPEEQGYLVTLSDYIHLNPVRAGLVTLSDKLFSYRWSSYPWYATTANRPNWFEPSRVMGELGLEDTKPGRQAYAERMRGRAVEERAAKESVLHSKLERGWCLGSASFQERMIRLLEHTKRGPIMREVDATLRQSHGEEQALKFMRNGLAACGLKEADLVSLKKNDERKVAIAALIRRRTTVPNKWIAQSLHLGHVSRVSRCWSQESALSAQLEKAMDEK
jgi:REP element-mobilizing transposase RayT